MGAIQNEINSAVGSLGQAAAVGKIVSASNQQKLERQDKVAKEGAELQGEIQEAKAGYEESSMQEAIAKVDKDELQELYNQTEAESLELEFKANSGEGLSDEEVKMYESGYPQKLNSLAQKIAMAEDTVKFYQAAKETQLNDFNQRKEFLQARL